MDIGSIFLILALLVLVGLYISRPFFERQSDIPDAAQSSSEHERSALLAERDRILNALQELDFDYTLGKIPEEDYPNQRATLLQRGAQVLRDLDVMQAGLESRPGAISVEEQPAIALTAEAEARLEAAVAARRADARRVTEQPAPGNGRQRVGVAEPDDDIEQMLAKRRRERQGKAGGFCPKCGAPVQKSDRFCPRCGATMA